MNLESMLLGIGWRVRLARGRLGHPVIPAIALALAAPFVWAVPAPATTQVGKLCEVQAGGYDIDQLGNTGLPVDQAIACELLVSGTLPYTNEPTSAYVVGSAAAGLGPAIPDSGTTRAASHAEAVKGRAVADLLAEVDYSFQILLSDPVPGTAPPLLPVLFGARGSGSVAQGGDSITRARGGAELFGPPLATHEAYLHFDLNQTLAGGFNDTLSIDLYPNQIYQVQVYAICEATVIGSGFGSCGAEADPRIGFDQTRFDTLMGAGTYRLDEHYRFEFSSNLPVPEPGVGWLMLCGLPLLVWAARRSPSSAAGAWPSSHRLRGPV